MQSKYRMGQDYLSASIYFMAISDKKVNSKELKNRLLDLLHSSDISIYIESFLFVLSDSYLSQGTSVNKHIVHILSVALSQPSGLSGV